MGPGRNRGGESVAGVSNVVGPPQDRSFGHSLDVGEGRWKGRYGGFEICRPCLLGQNAFDLLQALGYKQFGVLNLTHLNIFQI